MELGLGFADDDLKGDNKDVKICLTSYNAKICHPKWFLTAKGEDNETQANIKKYQGDYYYGNKNYSQAAQCYRDAIGFLSSQNRVTRKAMMESLARCYSYTGDETSAFKLIDELMCDTTTTDNMVQVLLLKQLVQNQFGRLQEEIETIHQLISYHPYNAQFWLLLMRAYKRLLDNDGHSYGHNNRAAPLTDSVNIQNIGEKVENIAITRSGSKEAQSKNQQQQSGDGPVQSLVKDIDRNYKSGSGLEKISQENSSHKEKLYKNCDPKLVQNIDGMNSEPQASSRLKLLTCCIAARLLLRSVEGTVGSFIKARNQELIQQVEQIQEDLHLEKSVIQAASEHMVQDFYQSKDTEEDDYTNDSPPQQNNKVCGSDGVCFEEKWFGWIKKL